MTAALRGSYFLIWRFIAPRLSAAAIVMGTKDEIRRARRLVSPAQGGVDCRKSNLNVYISNGLEG